MTLVVALIASDGVALASDGQATTDDPVASTRTAAEDKLWTLHGKIAFGCAGAAGLQQRVVRALNADISEDDCSLPVAELRPKLHKAVNAIQKQAADEHVDLGEAGGPPAAIEILFAGMSHGEPWVYGIAVSGVEEEHPNGEAIGNARYFPLYLMGSTLHYQLRDRGVGQVKVLAYRAVMDAIKADSTGLGPPVRLVVVDESGAERIVGDGLHSVEDALNGWKTQEHDIFKALPGEPPRDDSSTPVETGISADSS